MVRRECPKLFIAIADQEDRAGHHHYAVGSREFEGARESGGGVWLGNYLGTGTRTRLL